MLQGVFLRTRIGALGKWGRGKQEEQHKKQIKKKEKHFPNSRANPLPLSSRSGGTNPHTNKLDQKRGSELPPRHPLIPSSPTTLKPIKTHKHIQKQ